MEKIIQNYKFLNKVGDGSFAKVKIVQNINDQKLYASKIFNKLVLQKKKKLQQGKYVSDFDIVLNEISIHLQLDHQNIIKFYAILNQPNKLYFIQEYCQQGCLLNWDEKNRKFNGHKYNKTIIIDIINGIRYLHKNNFVHFDIKPQNILINDENQAKICDFGTSKKVTYQNDKFTFCETTLQFLSPETFKDKSFSGKQCDIWALGITLYSYFYKKLPWYDDNIYELFQKIKNDELQFPINLEINDEELFLQKILLQMLNKDPDQRINIDDVYQYFQA